MLRQSWQVLNRSLSSEVFLQQALFFNLMSRSGLCLSLLLATVAGWELNSLNVPVGWLLGPLAVGMFYAFNCGRAQPFPPTLGTVGQAIIGITTATRFSFETLILAWQYAIPLLLCIAVTGLISILNGYLLHKLANIDNYTSFLGAIPGNSASIIAMSEEIGADAIAVALLQFVRILLVAFVIPAAVKIIFPAETAALEVRGVTGTSASLLPVGINLSILYLCGIVGVVGGRFLKLPSALFLGPFLVSLLVFWIVPYSIYLPDCVFVLGLFLLGLSIGLKFDRQTANKLLKAVFMQLFLVTILILLCFTVGYIFHLITQVDAITAILGTTPGGISAMIATVIQLDGDAGLVMAMQVTRMLLILFFSPWLVTILNGSETRSP